MKTKPAIAALFVLSLSLPAFADTFTLKDGTTLDGVILSEAGDTYILEIQVTKSIKDERKVPKADVVKIDREHPDEKAFEALGKLTPTPDLMSEDDYGQKIRQVEKFLKDFPVSTKAKEAKEALAILKAEVADITGGGIKMNGKVIAEQDYKPNAYDLDARVEEMKIRNFMAANRSLLALREFADFDRDFRNTSSYEALLPQIKTTIQNYAGEANQQLMSFDRRSKARETGVQQMAPEDRGATAAAIREEGDAIEARYKAEKEAHQNWPTITPFHKQSLEDTVRFGQSELARLAAAKSDANSDGGKAYRELYNVVHSNGKASAVSTAVTAAKSAMVPSRYVAPLEAEAKGRK